jgi:arsenite methyltransferase
MDSTTIYNHVHTRYSATARTDSPTDHVQTVARAFGYSAEDLASIPSASNLGLSCGNPLALASLKQGETVVDLGCGAGFDVFLAAKKLGDKGRAIGVDMNEVAKSPSRALLGWSLTHIQDMLAKARANASKSHTNNVSFVHSRITAINLPDESADVVISNCVINLVPDAEKHLVFKEMHRLLRPGGRLAVSDILTRKPLPGDMKRNVALYVGCVAGASSKEEYEKWLGEAGFEDVAIVDEGSDLNVWTRGEASGCCDGGEVEEKEQACCNGERKEDGGVAEDMKRDLKEMDLNEWAGEKKLLCTLFRWLTCCRIV